MSEGTSAKQAVETDAKEARRKADAVGAGGQDDQFVDISLSPRGDHLELAAPVPTVTHSNSSDTIEPHEEAEAEIEEVHGGGESIVVEEVEVTEKLEAASGKAEQGSEEVVQDVPIQKEEAPAVEESITPGEEDGETMTTEAETGAEEEPLDTTETTTGKPMNKPEQAPVEPPKELAPSMYQQHGHGGKKKRKKNKRGKGKGGKARAS